MLTLDKTRGLTPPGVDRAFGSKRPQTSEASECESLDELHVGGANWSVKGKLARLEGDLKGNPFKALAELIDHDKLQMERDVSTNGMAKEILFFQICISCLINYFPLLFITLVSVTLFLSGHRSLSNLCCYTVMPGRSRVRRRG